MHRAPEEEIGYLLKRLMHVFRHGLELRLRRNADISFAHLVTLDQIQLEPGVAGAQLARNLLVTAQTMTELLKRLEQDGSIERREDPNNRRADRWYILPAGLERLATGRQAGSPVMTQMLSLLGPQDIVELRGYLERCVEGLERENRREGLPPPPGWSAEQRPAASRSRSAGTTAKGPATKRSVARRGASRQSGG
jgi:DNA-binding MarR family transcriptional regulator